MIPFDMWAETSAVVTFSKPTQAIIVLITCIFITAMNLLADSIFENQLPVDGDLPRQILKYLEDLGYKKFGRRRSLHRNFRQRQGVQLPTLIDGGR
jgi:hypothetical protein